MDPSAPANSSASALEQRLLDAARRDHIPDALSARMAAGLAVHAAGAGLPSGAHASSQASAHASVSASGKLSAPLLAKPGLWGALALAGAIGVAGFQLARPADGGSHGARAAQARIAAPAEVPRPAPVPVPVPVRPAAAEAVRPVPSAARAPAASDDSALRAEVSLLDRARNALRDGASARALRLLDQHQQRFAHPTLAPEAAVLRIEALVQRGEGGRVDALSQRFAASYPSHPLRARVDALRERAARRPASAAASTP